MSETIKYVSTHSGEDIDKGVDIALNFTTDSELDSTSTKPVQNKAIVAGLATKIGFDDVDDALSETSTKPVQNKVITDALNKKVDEAVGKYGLGEHSEYFNDYENNTANGDYSHAEGYTTASNGNYSHTEGSNTISDGDYSHAEGYITNAIGEKSHTENDSTKAYGIGSHAEGKSTESGDKHSAGDSVITINDSSSGIIEGISYALDKESAKVTLSAGTAYDGFYLSLGSVSIVKGESYTIHGIGSSIAGGYSMYLTLSSGDISEVYADDVTFTAKSTTTCYLSLHINSGTTIPNLVINISVKCTNDINVGEYSHAEGIDTKTFGNYSHAEGYKTYAIGVSSHAEGYNSVIANGDYSHAEGGNGTSANGEYSHAEGQSTYAIGNSSHSEGYSTAAVGDYSHAEGYTTNAGYSIYSGTSVVSLISMSGTSNGITYSVSGTNVTVSGTATDGVSVCIGTVALNSKYTYNIYGISGASSSTYYIGNNGPIGSILDNDFQLVAGSAGSYDGNYTLWLIIKSGMSFSESTTFNVRVENDDNIYLGHYSHSEGCCTSAKGDYSHTEGYGSIIASGKCSHAEGGYGVTASGDYSHAEGGYGTKAYGTASHAEGNGTHAYGDCSHSEGYSTSAGYTVESGNQLISFTNSSGISNGITYSVTNSGITLSGTATSTVTITLGSVYLNSNYTYKIYGITGSASSTYFATVNGPIGNIYGTDFALVAGSKGSYNNDYTVQFIILSGTTFSESTTIQVKISCTESLYFGKYSHAEGYATTASGECSHAEGGYSVVASGMCSHAEGGRSVVASGDFSHAEGGQTVVSIGNFSHAEGGNGVTSSGSFSHAEGGYSVTASGECSHAEGGYYVTASGKCSHAEGSNTIAYSEAQHAQGKYNVSDTEGKYADIVGNGTSEDARSNAYMLDWDGNILCGKTDTSGTITTYGTINGVDVTKLTKLVTLLINKNLITQDELDAIQ